MSYTFTSLQKNYNNNEFILNSTARNELDSMFTDSKSILMVGWRHDSDHSFVKYMVEKEKDITIVEIFEPNTRVTFEGVNIICNDILNYNFGDKKYDLFLWQHGPEHVKKEEALELFSKLKNNFKRVILETPYGFMEQDEMYGNVYEKHLSSWVEEDYENTGFKIVRYAGPQDNRFIIGYATY